MPVVTTVGTELVAEFGGASMPDGCKGGSGGGGPVTGGRLGGNGPGGGTGGLRFTGGGVRIGGGGGVQEEVVLQQQEAVLEKAAYQEDSHLLQLLGHFHDQKGTCLLSYKNPFHHSLYNVSLASVVLHKSYGPPDLHEIQTSFR